MKSASAPSLKVGWIKTLTVSALSSPRLSSFPKLQSPLSRNTTSGNGATRECATLTLQVLAALFQLVTFLETHHRREEGLYRRDGSPSESEKLLERALENDLPDLAQFSPHTITTVIKQILGDRFEPLIPYILSQQLLDRLAADASMDDAAFIALVRDTFKQVRSTSQSFLSLLLQHLNHVSAA